MAFVNEDNDMQNLSICDSYIIIIFTCIATADQAYMYVWII